MRISRYGKLTDSDISTGDMLEVQLHTDDIKALCDPSLRYCMDRFGGCSNGVAGWALEDKVHVHLENPEFSQDPEALANLSLDPGGDLYFSIWENERLKQAVATEDFNRESIVTSDPSDRLHMLGIEVVRLVNLDYLAHQLQHGDRVGFIRKNKF